MKKSLLFVSLLFLLIGCKNNLIINNNDVTLSEENKLPNGIVLSPEKEIELLEFTKAFNLKNGNRAFEENDDSEINEELQDDFIKALEEQYGTESELYYGDEEVFSETKEIPYIYDGETNSLLPLDEEFNISRAVSSISSLYVIKCKCSCVKHWGLWWQYYTYKVNLVAESIYTTEKYNLKTDKAYYEYKDSVTNKSAWVDWTKFDDPYNNGYPTGNSNADVAEQIRWAIAEANRGIIEIRGNTKYGWLPKVTNNSLYIRWYDDFIKNGSFSIYY